jgi:hypothetical protein
MKVECECQGMTAIEDRLAARGLTLPAVIDGFSHHGRSAIDVAELPFDMPVEIEAIVAL